MKKKTIFWLFSLAFLDITLIYLIMTRQIVYFLHPRMYIFIFFTIMALTALVLIETYLMIRGQKIGHKSSGHWIFIAPLLMLFIFQPKVIDSKTLENKVTNVDLGAQSLEKEKKSGGRVVLAPSTTEKDKGSDLNNKKDEGNVEISDENSQKRTVDKVDQAIKRLESDEPLPEFLGPDHEPIIEEINPKEVDFAQTDGAKYKEALTTAYTHMNDGTKLEITGFAFFQKQFRENEVSISRLLMTCCAADSSVMGLLTDISDFKDKVGSGKWYKVYGTIKKTTTIDPMTGHELTVPILIAEKVQEIEVPLSPYVYP